MVYLDNLAVYYLNEIGFIFVHLLEHSDQNVFFIIDENLLCHGASSAASLILIGKFRARAVCSLDVQSDQTFFQQGRESILV